MARFAPDEGSIRTPSFNRNAFPHSMFVIGWPNGPSNRSEPKVVSAGKSLVLTTRPFGLWNPRLSPGDGRTLPSQLLRFIQRLLVPPTPHSRVFSVER